MLGNLLRAHAALAERGEAFGGVFRFDFDHQRVAGTERGFDLMQIQRFLREAEPTRHHLELALGHACIEIRNQRARRYPHR